MNGRHQYTRTSRLRPSRRVAVLLPVLVVVPAVLAGCGVKEDRYSAACAVVIDGSGSGQASPEGFDAEAKLKSSLDGFLKDQHCRVLSYGAITRASESSSCDQPEIEIDPDAEGSTDRGALRQQRRVYALSGALKMLGCARRENSGSDILGALERVLLKREDRGEPFHVLVVSDFIQGDKDFDITEADLTTARSRGAAIDELESLNRLPEALEGVDVYPVGYGMRYGEKGSKFEDFDQFWTEILEERVRARVHDDYR